MLGSEAVLGGIRMMAKQALVGLLVPVLAFAAVAVPSPLGNVTSSQAAYVRGVVLAPGSTIFSGDTIEVSAGGNARITLAGGAQIQLGEMSQIQLLRNNDKIQLAMGRGIVSFRTEGSAGAEALLADATIRPADGAPAVALIQVRSPDSAVIAAHKGSLVILTAHDGKSVTLREGDGVEVKMASDDPPPQASKKKPAGTAVPGAPLASGKMIVYMALIAGAATAIGLLLGLKKEPSGGAGPIVSRIRP